MRSLLFFEAAIPLRGFAVYTLAALLVYAAGYAFFQRLRPGFSDVV
jgi:ABC-type polysaccharide/polyol phosphate export permease